jgi:hypothetical protein
MTLPVAVEFMAEQGQPTSRVTGGRHDLSSRETFFRAAAAFEAVQRLGLTLGVGRESVYNGCLEILWQAEIIRSLAFRGHCLDTAEHPPHKVAHPAAV